MNKMNGIMEYQLKLKKDQQIAFYCKTDAGEF